MSHSCFQDHYTTLELPFPAAGRDIKQSYHRLARLHHPDKNGGSVVATEKFQKIIAAYETLSDETKKRTYDASYTYNRSSAQTKKPNNPSSAQRDTTQTRNEDAEKESVKKRQEWLRWLGRQQWSIEEKRKQIQKIEKEIEKLESLDNEATALLAAADRFWANMLWFSRVVLSEEQRSQIQRESLDRLATRRVKHSRIEVTQKELSRLEGELDQRRRQENNRLFQEKIQKQMREEAERQSKEEAARKAREEMMRKSRAQQEAWERVERERREREYNERLEKAREKVKRDEKERREKEQAKREREKREKEMRAQRAELERKRQAGQIREWEDYLKRTQKSRKQETKKEAGGGAADSTGRNRQRTGPSSSYAGKRKKHDSRSEKSHYSQNSTSCTHKAYWKQEQGRHHCIHCSQTQNKFFFECPRCGTKACASCRDMLKRGENPTKRSFEKQHQESAHDYFENNYSGYSS